MAQKQQRRRQKAARAPACRTHFPKQNSKPYLFKWQTGGAFALIALLALAAYSNSFRVPFTFDDITHISTNPAIRSFGTLLNSPAPTRLFFYFTLFVNYSIGGLGVLGYHIFNLGFHILVALLVFGLVALTLRTPFFDSERKTGYWKYVLLLVPAFTALLFVAHPLQTEAVTYIYQRSTSLVALFYLLSLVAYIKWRLLGQSSANEKNSPFSSIAKSSMYVCALVAALIAMITKENAFTLPVILLVWELLFMSGNIRKRLIGLAPFFLTPALIPLILLFGHAPLLEAQGTSPAPSHLAYLFTQFRVIVTYIRLIIWPAGQNLDYDYPLYSSFFHIEVLLSFVLLVSIFAGAVAVYYYSRNSRLPRLAGLGAFGIFWFFITLSVESSLITFPDLIFEHRLYLPLVGFLLALIVALTVLASFVHKRVRWIYPALGACLSIPVLVLAGTTYARNSQWNDPVAFWQDSVARSPGKARVHLSLAGAYWHNGLADDALREDQIALSIDPDIDQAHLLLAQIYSSRHQDDDAIREYNRSLELNPGLAIAHDGLGWIHLLRNETDQAEGEYKKALQIDNNTVSSHMGLGMIYQSRGQLTEAETEFQVVISSEPSMALAHFLLGRVYLDEGRPADAIAVLNKYISINPGDYKAYTKLGDAYLALGNMTMAGVQYQRALSLKPDYEDARKKLQQIQGTY